MKIHFFLKNKEKAITLNDNVHVENIKDYIENFLNVFQNQNKIIVLEFSDDFLIINNKDIIDAIIITKPEIKTLDLENETDQNEIKNDEVSTGNNDNNIEKIVDQILT